MRGEHLMNKIAKYLEVPIVDGAMFTLGGVAVKAAEPTTQPETTTETSQTTETTNSQDKEIQSVTIDNRQELDDKIKEAQD